MNNLDVLINTQAMNDTIKQFGEAGCIDVAMVSDGYHTFADLYFQRLCLTAALFNSYPDLAYKTRRHDDGSEPFGGGWFLVSIGTPKGQYSYHYEDKYWDLFTVPEREKAEPFDGHTSKDVDRLLSLVK